MSRSKRNGNYNPPTPGATGAGEGDQALAGDTVFVALNHPSGIKFTLKDGRQVVIKGHSTHLRGKEMGILPVGRYGLTQVSKDDWEEIQRIYGRMEIFQNGLIFARPRKSEAEDQAEEMRGTRHGREPVNPETTNTTEAKDES